MENRHFRQYREAGKEAAPTASQGATCRDRDRATCGMIRSRGWLTFRDSLWQRRDRVRLGYRSRPARYLASNCPRSIGAPVGGLVISCTIFSPLALTRPT